MILNKDNEPHDCVIAMTRENVPVLAENEQELAKIMAHLKPNKDEKVEYMKAQYEYNKGQPLIFVPGNGKQEDMMLQIIQYKENADGTSIGKIARVK